jgi:S-sulfo-L-cysteine synthase (O-acetyl-L-serine-dependent)
MPELANVARGPDPYPELDGFLAYVGRTPLVPLHRLCRDLLHPGVEIWAKLEWFNPSGSVKARAALAMVLDAERTGRLRPGMQILDASSGNTGIAYALIAAHRGYGLTLCLPTNANDERKTILKAYGVEIVETSPLEGSDGAIRRARELIAAHPDRYVYLDQYSNDANWQAHFQTTGPEIWRETGGRLTHWVATLGTSGTFIGTSRYLRSQNPAIQCFSVQPDSPFHGLEGLKHMETAIVPSIYDDSVATENLGAPTEESLELVRRLARQEGLLVGPSSGAALWAALEVARPLTSGMVVTLFPDGGERYLSEAHIFERA